MSQCRRCDEKSHKHSLYRDLLETGLPIISCTSDDQYTCVLVKNTYLYIINNERKTVEYKFCFIESISCVEFYTNDQLIIGTSSGLVGLFTFQELSKLTITALLKAEQHASRHTKDLAFNSTNTLKLKLIDEMRQNNPNVEDPLTFMERIMKPFMEINHFCRVTYVGVVFIDSNKYIVTGDQDGKIFVMTYKKYLRLENALLYHNTAISDIVLFENTLVSRSIDNTIIKWNIKLMKPDLVVNQNEKICCLSHVLDINKKQFRLTI